MGMLMRRRIREIQVNQDEMKEPEVHVEENPEEPAAHKYSKEELAVMTVKQIKEIAAERGIVISKIIKDDVISEFLSQQE